MVPGRGELFYRFHRHADPDAPIAFLLHGWTASGDLQFFTAYEALAAHCSFITFDYRGHGRGLRLPQRFELEDVADDAAALLTALGVSPVIAVGYSMGGPVAMLLTRRHPQLVRAIVLEATALEWCSSFLDRLRWKTARIIGPLLRSLRLSTLAHFGIRRLLGRGHPLQSYVPWLSGEMRRNDPQSIVQAGQALSRYDARPWAAELRKPAALADHDAGSTGQAAQATRARRGARRRCPRAARRSPQRVGASRGVCRGHCRVGRTGRWPSPRRRP